MLEESIFKLLEQSRSGADLHRHISNFSKEVALKYNCIGEVIYLL